MIKLLSLTCWRRLAQGSVLALALQLLATGGAWAADACDVTLSSMLSMNQAVLKANCGSNTTQIKTITWTRDLGSVNPAPVSFGPFSFPPTTADLFFTTLLTSGTHSYTATGVDSNNAPVGSGKAAVITLSQPILTVAVSNGGSVTSAPVIGAPGINGCTVTGGSNCASGYDTSTTVVLTPTANSGNSFSNWGGDCSGPGNTCTVSMTTLRTVTATFSNVPSFAVNGVVNNAAGGSVSCNPSSVTSGNTSACTINTNSGWTLTGASSSTCGGSLSGNTYTTGGVTSACTVTVNFSQTPTSFTVTTTANPSNGGTVTCSPNPVNAGGNSSCSAVANAGYTLTAGNLTSNCPGSPFANQFNIVGINSACSVTANFTQSTSQSFAVNGVANPSAGGSVSCNPSSVTSGGTSSCTITTNSGYTLTGTNSTCGGSAFGSSGFNTGAVTSACTVTATFSSSNTANCGSGEVFRVGDADWNPMVTRIFPQQALTASGDFGRAVRFIADAKTYPNGVTVTMIDQSSATLPKDAVISACAHSFTPLGGNPACAKSGIGNQVDFILKFGAAQRFYDCPLTPGGTYYINFRDYNTPRGDVSSQFVNYAR